MTNGSGGNAEEQADHPAVPQLPDPAVGVNRALFTTPANPGGEANPSSSRPPVQDLVTMYELALADLHKANKEREAERKEKAEAQRQVATLMTRFEELKKTLEATAHPAQGEQSHSTRHSRPGTGSLGPGPVIQMQVPLNPPELVGMGPPPIPQPMLEQEAESLPHTNRSETRTANVPPVPRRGLSQRVVQADSTNDATAQILERMHQLEQRLIRAESGVPAPTQNPLFASRPGPFTAAILQAVRPAYAKTPKMAHYGGMSDPFVHMDTFKKVTNNKGFDDATLCHLFSETLDGEAMNWFFECPPGSVSSFTALSHAFLSRFILLSAGHHNTSQLFSVKQGEDESLKAFVTRWRAAASQCRDLDKTMASAAFRKGLLKGPFLYHLNYNHPNATYDHVMSEAVIHAQAEFITYGEIPPPPTPKSAQPSSSHKETASKTPSAPSTDKKREWPQGHHQSKRQKDQQYHKGNRPTHGDNRNKQAESSQRKM
ncbi:uncharacterized protein LOC133720792 [Rosa rugosa]|uniref:uncharacterized protein LOC133720792 n=1 Tax=Rosa rugosa TaxID=74645 RepID=UPI002B4012BB|nr:uncharacterized protein LOC133720792 [Rosa rugosa]